MRPVNATTKEHGYEQAKKADYRNTGQSNVHVKSIHADLGSKIVIFNGLGQFFLELVVHFVSPLVVT